MRCDPFRHSTGHFVERHIQGVRDGPNADCGRVEDAPFHPADRSPLKSTFGARPFLGESRGPAKLGHDHANSFPFEVGRLNLAPAPLHSEASRC